MDPNEILIRLEWSIMTAAYGDAVEELHAYYHWRIKGGYEPDGGDTLAEHLAMELADALDNL